MAACQNGHEACAQALLQAGADPSSATSDGETALTRSRENKHAACTGLLLQSMGLFDAEGK